MASSPDLAPSLFRRTARALGARRVLDAWTGLQRNLNDLRYEVHARYLANPRSAGRLAQHAPVLAPLQQRVVGDLQQRGIAMAPFHQLFGARAQALWSPFEKLAREFEQSERVRQDVGRYRANLERAAWKEYVVKRFIGPPPTLELQDPLLNIAVQPELLDIVNSYLGLWSKLRSLNLWYTIPFDGPRSRAASQNWHRDPEDRRLVKAFLYVDAVDDAAGPLEYIPESRRGGKYAYLWPLPKGGGFDDGSYPNPAEVEAAVPAGDRFVGKCPAATFLFCDTSGFHRGGFATTRARLLGTWMFVTPASRARLDFKVDPRSLPTNLDPAARYALAERRLER
jgi:hypothetical protein